MEGRERAKRREARNCKNEEKVNWNMQPLSCGHLICLNLRACGLVTFGMPFLYNHRRQASVMDADEHIFMSR